MRKILILLVIINVVGCDKAPEPPSQQAVEAAWKRADQAEKQSVAAKEEVKHIARLREIDRLRHDADVADLQSHESSLHGLSVMLAIALLASLLWLAVEIRRRRLIASVLEYAPAEDFARDNGCVALPDTHRDY